MRQFRVQCQSCGDVLVRARDVTLPGGCYCFDCPKCGAFVRQPAGERETALLAMHGAVVMEDAPEPDAAVELPPLTLDDVITLHELLQDDDWFESMLNASTPAGTTAAQHRRPLPGRHDGQGRRY
jgi:hypothetical protein